MMTEPTTFIKGKDKIADQGQDYEKLNCLRILQVLEEKNKPFCVGNNVTGFGDFDDLICKIKHDTGKNQFLFLQLKYANNQLPIISTAEKSQNPKNPNCIEDIVNKSFSSFITVHNSFKSTEPEYKLIDHKFDDCDVKFAYLTVRKISDNVKNMLEQVSDASDLLKSVTSNNGICFKIPDLPDAAANFYTNSQDPLFPVFIQKFRIFVEQMSLSDIEIKIKLDLPEFERDDVYNSLKDDVVKWYKKNGPVEFLTLSNHLFKNQILSKYYKKNPLNLPRSNIQFGDQFLTNLRKKKVICSSYTDKDLFLYNLLITNIEPYVQDRDFPRDSEILVMDHRFTPNLLERMITDNCSFNRIFYNVTNSNQFHEFLPILKKFTQQNNKFLFLLIKQDCYESLKDEPLAKDLTKFEFKQLSDSSKQKILDKTIKFQDIEISFSKAFSGTDFMNHAGLISEVVNRNQVDIGEKMEGLGEVSFYYQPRFFQICDLKSFCAFIEATGSTDLHLIINNDRKEQTIKSNANWKIIHSENDFNEQRGRSQNQNVHLFEWKEKSVRHIRSSGPQHSMKTFLDFKNNSEAIIPEANLTESYIKPIPEKKNIIISDVPGNGKSITLLKLSEQLKKKFKEKYIILINLNTVKESFKTNDKFGSHEYTPLEAVDFIANIMIGDKNAFGRAVFKKFCDMPEKVILLFDAYDEICPTYENCVKSLIKALKLTQIQNIIICTRPQYAEELHSFLPGIILTMLKFDKDTQALFLEKIWTREIHNRNILPSGDDLVKSSDSKQGDFVKSSALKVDVIVKSCALKLVELVHSDKMANLKQVTGIPLLLSIFSLVQFTLVNDSIAKGKSQEITLEEFSFKNLYDQYLKIKVTMYLEEKLKITEAMAIDRSYKNQEAVSLKIHSHLALVELFSREIIENIFGVPHEQDFSEHTIEALGILIKRGTNQYSFLHRTFAEYFCALELMRFTKDKFAKKQAKHFLIENVLPREEFSVVRTIFDDALGEYTGTEKLTL